MKKLLSIIVLSVLLLGVGGAALADEGDSCCPASGDVCVPAAACVGAVTAVPATDPPTCSTAGTCAAAGTGAGAPPGLKEFCTLGSNIVWKSGTVDGATNGDDCATTPFCTLEAGNTVGSPTSGETYKTAQWGMICLINSVNSVTNWIFYLLMVFVVVMVVIGGATYMLASGDPEKAGKGKSIIIYGIVGLVIALLARLIPSVVKLIVGM